RARLGGGPQWRGDEDGDGRPDPDLSDPNAWDLAAVVTDRGFTTDDAGKQTLTFTLPPGLYRAMLETKDRFGKKVTARLPIRVLQPGAEKLALKGPHLVGGPKWSLEPGEEFLAVWGTGYETGRAFVEVEHRGRMVQRYWTKAG